MGLVTQTRDYADGTSVTQVWPRGAYVRARALCSDGKVRTVRLGRGADYSVWAARAAVGVGL
jgi:hypothetical protein